MKKLLLFLIASCALPARAQNSATTAPLTTKTWSQRLPLALRSAEPDTRVVAQWNKFELTLDLSANYDNPFDPAQIDVWAVFTSPQGKTIRVNGFLWGDYTRRLDGKNEIIEAKGAPAWKIRFAPPARGAWRYRVWARDRSGLKSLPQAALIVAPASGARSSGTSPVGAIPSREQIFEVNGPEIGFVRRSVRNPRAFALENERPFVPIGENIGWAGNEGSFEFDRWLEGLGRAGGNWMRVWMSSWNAALEWTPPREGSWQRGEYHGLGVYSLDNAWKLDTILDSAERNGIYTMVCFGTYGEFKTGGFFNEGQWANNPYNVTNGGPCATPEDFWTNPQARAFYRRRLRYIAARYGWRTRVFAWEFWNEAEAPVLWVGEMARFLKGTGEFKTQGPADPHGHLVSTTYGNEAIWKLPEIDFSMTHSYGDTGSIPDHAPVIAADAQTNATWGKPHIMAEFGIDWRAGDEKYDPRGRAVNFHNGLWSSMAAGNAGGAMLWWWDGYVHPKNLYAQLTPLRRFSDSVAWTAGPWKPMRIDSPRVIGGRETFSDLQLTGNGAWGKAATSDFVVGPSGLKGFVTIPSYLYSPSKADMRTTPVFRVDYKQAGRFAIRVNTVSSLSRIQFSLDGKVVLDERLDATPPVDPKEKPGYEKTEMNAEWKNYRAVFNRELSIDVPAGRHVIQLANVEGDWASLDSITLGGYRSSLYPDVHIYGTARAGEAVLWVQNAMSNWKTARDQTPIVPLRNLVVPVRDWPDGRYRVQFWDTQRGVVTKSQMVAAKNRALDLNIDDLPTDVAIHITSASP